MPAAFASIQPSLASEARASACAIGERLIEALRAEPVLDVNFELAPIRGFQGTSGYAAFFFALWQATGNERYRTAALEQFTIAVKLGDVPEAGVLAGMAGLRGALAYARTLDARFESVIAQCDAYIGGHAPHSDAIPHTYGDYDIPYGWSGIRLARSLEGPIAPDRFSEHLVWLLESDERWCCRHELRGGDPPEHCIGLAHGVAGILSALALSLTEFDDRARRAMARACSGLAARSTHRRGLITWARNWETPEPERFRAVWCYGTAGVATALLECAVALDDPALRAFALESFDSMLGVAPEVWNMGGLGLCHGTAGNALMLFNAARLSGEPRYEEAAQTLLSGTIAELRRNGHRHVTLGFDTRPYDAIGTLNGVAGIGLALLTVSRLASERWMRLLGIGYREH